MNYHGKPMTYCSMTLENLFDLESQTEQILIKFSMQFTTLKVLASAMIPLQYFCKSLL